MRMQRTSEGVTSPAPRSYHTAHSDRYQPFLYATPRPPGARVHVAADSSARDGPTPAPPPARSQCLARARQQHRHGQETPQGVWIISCIHIHIYIYASDTHQIIPLEPPLLSAFRPRESLSDPSLCCISPLCPGTVRRLSRRGDRTPLPLPPPPEAPIRYSRHHSGAAGVTCRHLQRAPTACEPCVPRSQQG